MRRLCGGQCPHCCSGLPPEMLQVILAICQNSNEYYAGDRIRTCESTKLMGPRPIPFDRSGIPASNVTQTNKSKIEYSNCYKKVCNLKETKLKKKK